MNPEIITAFSTVLVPLCSMIAAIVSAIFANRASKDTTKTRVDKKDSDRELATRINHVEESLRSQGHQIGEIRADMQSLRKDLSTLIANEVLK